MNAIPFKVRRAVLFWLKTRRSIRRASSTLILFLFLPSISHADVPVIYSSSAHVTLTDPAIPSQLVGMFVAANSDFVMASTPNVNTSTGAVLVYDRHTGELLRRLMPHDGQQNDFFGTHLDLDGNKLIAGTNGYGNAAYVFDVSTGHQLQEFSQPPFASDAFGFSVALKGNLAVVGDPADSVAGDQTGAAYILDIPTGNILWTLRGTESNPYRTSFGNEVAIDERYAYIGSPGGAGYVYQYDLTTGALVRRVRGSDTQGGDYFGSTIAVDNGRLLVGAFDHINGASTGAAYLFNSQTGAQLREFVAPAEAGRFGQFGLSADLSGDSVLIGAPQMNLNAISSVGSAYLYNLSSATPVARFQPTDLQFNLKFGLALKLDGTTAIISSPGFQNYDGAVYLFEVPEPRIGITTVISCYFVAFIFIRHHRLPGC